MLALKNEEIVISAVSFQPWKTIKNPAQVALAKKLFEKYPNPTFWKSLHLDFKPMDLNFFLTVQGSTFLHKSFGISKLEEPKRKVYKVSSKPIGEDTIPTTKSSNLKEFLYGKKSSN